MNPLTFRPSLLAGLDAVIKIGGVFVAFGLSVFLPVVLSRDGPEGIIVGFTVMMFGTPFIIPAIIAALLPVVRLAYTTYTVDDEGIRVRTQILEKTERRVQWDKVTTLRHRRTVIDRLLGIERLDVVAYGQRGTTLSLVGLRDAPALRDLVGERMLASASVEGLFRND